MTAKRIRLIMLLAIFVSLSILTTLLLCGFTTQTASAETVSESQITEEVNEGSTEQEQPETPAPETLGSRIEQWFENNFLEFLSSINLGGVVACVVAVIIEHRGNKKASKLSAEALGINTSSNSEVVKAVNALIEQYNETLDRLHSMETQAEQQEHILATLENSTKAMLEILATVYANNKNIPQAVKDLVNIKYVQALKAELPQPVVETEDKGGTEEG